jgi:hypothetical protein
MGRYMFYDSGIRYVTFGEDSRTDLKVGDKAVIQQYNIYEVGSVLNRTLGKKQRYRIAKVNKKTVWLEDKLCLFKIRKSAVLIFDRRGL